MTHRIIKTIVGAAFVIAASTQFASAEAELWQCTIKDGKEGTWVPQTVVLAFDKQTNETIVMDSVIMAFMKKPIPVKTKIRGNRMQFFWRVTGARDSFQNQIPSMNYAAFYNIKTRNIAVSAKVGGYSQVFSGKGSCKVVEGNPDWKKAMRDAQRIKPSQKN